MQAIDGYVMMWTWTVLVLTDSFIVPFVVVMNASKVTTSEFVTFFKTPRSKHMV